MHKDTPSGTGVAVSLSVPLGLAKKHWMATQYEHIWLGDLYACKCTRYHYSVACSTAL